MVLESGASDAYFVITYANPRPGPGLIEKNQATLGTAEERVNAPNSVRNHARKRIAPERSGCIREIRPRRERGHGIENNQIHGATPDQRVDDFERLFRISRLREEESVWIHPD
jgi:hypothetical protein